MAAPRARRARRAGRRARAVRVVRRRRRRRVCVRRRRPRGCTRSRARATSNDARPLLPLRPAAPRRRRPRRTTRAAAARARGPGPARSARRAPRLDTGLGAPAATCAGDGRIGIRARTNAPRRSRTSREGSRPRPSLPRADPRSPRPLSELPRLRAAASPPPSAAAAAAAAPDGFADADRVATAGLLLATSPAHRPRPSLAFVPIGRARCLSRASDSLARPVRSASGFARMNRAVGGAFALTYSSQRFAA